ncbi:MAG: GNAT family N-acetyltransferase [Cyanobacteria bacterium J06639_1]
MIRLACPDDTPAFLSIAKEANGFEPEELDVFRNTLSDYFAGKSSAFWVTDDDEGMVVGVAYCEPERMARGTWNLLFIAIHPDLQGCGRGTALIRAVEEIATERGARLLLVETSGTPDFDRTRTFYRKCQYEEEARIREFYAAGDDKIVFRKLLRS